jgi:glycerol-3-phosphate dehydrogenase
MVSARRITCCCLFTSTAHACAPSNLSPCLLVTSDIKASMRQVAEGVATAMSVHDLAAVLGMELPICEEVRPYK